MAEFSDAYQPYRVKADELLEELKEYAKRNGSSKAVPARAVRIKWALDLEGLPCFTAFNPLASVIAETIFGNEVQHDKVQSRCACSNPSARAESLGEFRLLNAEVRFSAPQSAIPSLTHTELGRARNAKPRVRHRRRWGKCAARRQQELEIIMTKIVLVLRASRSVLRWQRALSVQRPIKNETPKPARGDTGVGVPRPNSSITSG